MTTREFYTAIINTEGVPLEIVEHAQSALAKLDEANARRKTTPSKTQIENAPIMDAIVKYATDNAGAHTATEIATALEISRNKSASLCSKLEKDGKLHRARTDKTGAWAYSAI